MSKILYYPYINLPNSNWTLRTLFYYDNIGSIVPDEFFYNPDKFDPFMLELIKQGLVTAINPMNVIEKPNEVTKPFLKLIEKNKDQLKKSRKQFRNNKGARISSEKFTGTKLHVNKFDADVLYSLKELGLAEHGYDNWYYVEKRTANELMKFLANIVSIKTDRTPTTDIIRKRLIVPNLKKDELKKREKILEDLIPFPENMSLNRVLKFKENNEKNLISFRNQVELIVFNPNIEIDSQLFNERVRELNLRKEELVEKMNESKFGNIIFGTVCGIFGAYQGLELGSTFGAFLSSLPGFGNALHSALKIEKAEDIFDQSGMKYLALAEKREII